MRKLVKIKYTKKTLLNYCYFYHIVNHCTLEFWSSPLPFVFLNMSTVA